jgi:Type II CAAX prenyl endopeptidase Rce1-like
MIKVMAPPSAEPRAARKANLLTSVMLVFPLFLVYQVGVLALPSVYNGADLITSQLIRLLHGRLGLYLAVNGALLALFVVLMIALRRKNDFRARMFVPVVLESALYAVTMGALIVFVMRDLLHVSPNLQIAAETAPAPESVGPVGKIVLACGAGVHEELVFRLLMVPALIAAFGKLLKLRRGVAVLLAFVTSAVLFSAAHHVIGGEPWRVWPFLYRFFCGMIFAALFQWRGFAVAVYTHTLYDVFVLVFQA